MRGIYLRIALALLGIFLILSWIFKLDPLSESAREYCNRGVRSTLTSYIIVRGINAGVSVLKESELSLSPAGVGLSLAFGQVLDPVDDATERLSFLLMVSFLSFGIQKIAIEILSDPLLLLGGILSLITALSHYLSPRVYRFSLFLLLTVLTVRFLLPLTYLLSDLIYQLYVEDNVRSLNENLAKFKALFTDLNVSNVEVLKEKLKTLSSLTDRAVKDILELSLYYFFQTIILPIFNLWTTLKLSLFLVRRGVD